MLKIKAPSQYKLVWVGQDFPEAHGRIHTGPTHWLKLTCAHSEGKSSKVLGRLMWAVRVVFSTNSVAIFVTSRHFLWRPLTVSVLSKHWVAIWVPRLDKWDKYHCLQNFWQSRISLQVAHILCEICTILTGYLSSTQHPGTLMKSQNMKAFCGYPWTLRQYLPPWGLKFFPQNL